MMYCTFCGKQIAEDAAFCGYCGKPVPQRNDLAKLVAAARAGDQDAVSALYEKTYSKVYYTVRSMIKDKDAVFDIVQDTYIKAFSHLDAFQGDTRFLPWIRQIAANTARDWLKKKRPMLFTELAPDDGQDTPVEELFPNTRSEDLPEQVIDQNETKRLIREILEELPEDQRAAVGMFYYEEMSVKQIAAAMGASESAVKSRLMYARGKIEKKVRELEKKGTKLYGLAPLPFLLLLFRGLKTGASEVPDAQILQAVLASQPAGTAAAAGTTAAAAGSEASGAAAAGTAGTAAGTGGMAAAAGGFGALKLGIAALAAAAVVGLGVFGAAQIISPSDPPQKPPVRDDIAGGEGSETPERPGILEGSDAPEEPAPLDEALEQYRTIISQADSYDYGKYAEADQSWEEFAGYRYALVQMRSDDPVPTLLLEREIKDTEQSVSNYYIRVFQYDPDTKTMRQPAEVIGDGGIRGGLSMAGDGEGMFSMSWESGTGEAWVRRITLNGDPIVSEIFWTGRVDLMPDSITFIDIEWHEIGDVSALDSWTAPEPGGAALPGSTGSGALLTDGDRIVLTGTVGTYSYDQIVELQRQPDPIAPYYIDDAHLSGTYRVIVLDAPQTLYLHHSGGGDSYSSNEVLMICIDNADGMEQYEGRHITFSIDPATTHWPSEAAPPVGQPFTSDIHVLE